MRRLVRVALLLAGNAVGLFGLLELALRAQEPFLHFYDAYDAIAEAYARDPGIYFTRDMHFRPEGQRAWGRAHADAFAPWVLANAN